MSIEESSPEESSTKVVTHVLRREVLKEDGTFREIFDRAWPQFRHLHAGGEEMARLRSYEILTELNMSGAITKEGRVFKAIERSELSIRRKPGKK